MAGRRTEDLEIDTRTAHASRIYDFLLGGKNNFAVDREVAKRGAAVQGGLDNARTAVCSNRAFLGRAVRHLAGRLGIRQFLDIGTGIPTEDNVHEVAQRTAPEARVVYVDYDPVVLAHAHKLLDGSPEGVTSYVLGDLRDPQAILEQAADTLDFTKPVSIMLVSMLHFFPDDEEPYDLVAHLLRATPPGSYLAMSHLTSDIRPGETAAMADRYNESSYEEMTLRTKAEVARFLDGLEILEPGVVQIDRWHQPEEVPSPPKGWLTPMYAAIGRKP